MTDDGFYELTNNDQTFGALLAFDHSSYCRSPLLLLLLVLAGFVQGVVWTVAVDEDGQIAEDAVENIANCIVVGRCVAVVVFFRDFAVMLKMSLKNCEIRFD
eukprot:gene4607-biopygen5365